MWRSALHVTLHIAGLFDKAVLVRSPPPTPTLSRPYVDNEQRVETQRYYAAILYCAASLSSAEEVALTAVWEARDFYTFKNQPNLLEKNYFTICLFVNFLARNLGVKAV